MRITSLFFAVDIFCAAGVGFSRKSIRPMATKRVIGAARNVTRWQ